MPRNVNPYVVLIGKSELIPENARSWLEILGVEESRINEIIHASKTSAEKLVEVAGRRCYMSFQPGLNPNVIKIRTDVVEYIDNILASAHGSVIEHVSFNFAIENVSRVFTGEMNRHRAGMAISEGSMRYIRYEDIPYWVPNVFRNNNTDCGGLTSKEEISRDIFFQAFKDAEKHYKALCNIWAEELSPTSKFSLKKELTSAMRRIIPMGVATGGIWTGNIRALRNIFEMRCSPHAEEEILLVATMLLNVMREAEPSFFGDFNTDELGFSKPKYHKV